VTAMLDTGQPPAPVPGRSHRAVAAVLAIVVVLLAGAEAYLLVSSVHRNGPADRRLAALQAQATTDHAQGESPGAPTPPPADLEALQRDYQAVRAADQAVDAAITTWTQGGHPFSVVLTAIETCYRRADDFDQAAAPYSAADLKGVVPQAVDLHNAATDCGGQGIGRITGPLA
jgi:hypothetical protein